MAKKLKWNLILMSLLYLALGIFLLMVPGTALNVVCYALGGVVLACAAVQLVRYFVVERGVFQSQLTLISGWSVWRWAHSSLSAAMWWCGCCPSCSAVRHL